MIDINWKPSNKDLRIFATAWLVFTAGFGVAFWLKGGAGPLVKTLWVAGPAVFGLGMLRPQLIRFLYVGLSLVAFPIGFVIGNVLMALVFYLLVTPVGLVFRLLGRDLLDRKLDPEAPSYWSERPPPRKAERYFRQF